VLLLKSRTEFIDADQLESARLDRDQFVLLHTEMAWIIADSVNVCCEGFAMIYPVH